MSRVIDKSQAAFPVKDHHIFLNHCGVSPLAKAAATAISSIALEFSLHGSAGISHAARATSLFRESLATLLATSPGNISIIKSSAEGLNLVALGLNLTAGDEIISYKYEYPSNHYPWRFQEKRGAKLVLIEGELTDGRPLRFDLKELQAAITARTKVIALSHVQFTSGFACDLEQIAKICRANNIIFVVDAAQSLGCMPLNPEKLGIDVLVSSGWKWMLGPLGASVLYTSPAARAQIEPVFGGPDMMKQGEDYLNHNVDPCQDGKKFEYSTTPCFVALGLAAALNANHLHYGIENVWSEIKKLQTQLINGITNSKLKLVPLAQNERSGITSYTTSQDPRLLAAELLKSSIVCTSRGGYLRFAPHFYNSDQEIARVIEAVNQLG